MTRRNSPRACRGSIVCVHRATDTGLVYFHECDECGALLPLGPANDTPEAVQDELIAIEVTAGERAMFGQTSGTFRCGYNETIDPCGYHAAGYATNDTWDPDATWLRQYQSGAFAAHLDATHTD